MATTVQVKNFIAQIAPLIQAEAKARGYKVVSAVIAQACIESGFGLSSLSAKYHNYFGLKCGSSWKGASVNMKTKEEYKAGTLTTIKANFRAYGSMKEGVAGYYDFIQYKRYANLKTATTAREYLERIKADGYATSSTYVQTNMNVVEKYVLTVWDNFTGAAQIVAASSQTKPNINYKVGETYTLKSNMFVRTAPRGKKKTFAELTADGQKNAYAAAGVAVLKKGTRVTVQSAVVTDDGAVWVKIPSGYVCGVDGGGKVYIA